MTLKAALPLLALLPSACAGTSAPQPILAVAEQRHCPPYPLPPAELLKAPATIDFLTRSD